MKMDENGIDTPASESRPGVRPTSHRHVLLIIDPPIPARFEGIGRFAREHGWRLTLANRLVRAPRGWNGDGAIVTLRDDPAVLRFADGLAKRGIPVVDITFHRPEVTVPRAIPDYHGAGLVAAQHFFDIGLKRTAWFSTEWSNVQRLFFKGLAEGFGKDCPPAARATPARRCDPPARFVLSELLPRSRLDDPDRFAEVLAPRLHALPKPVGILAYNDEEAARIAALCLDIGILVPEEVAILGIGNDAFLCENQAVPISSVIDDLERNGYEGAALLARLMDGAPTPKESVIS